jgi:hypothetical protein
MYQPVLLGLQLRQRLQVTRREGGFHVRDLNSTNGTFAAGLRLFEAEVPLNAVPLPQR